MVILQYGTNEAANQALDITTYTNHLRQSLKHLRAAHAHARCVLIGAPDRGNGNYSALHQRVNAVQERVSQEFQCEFWNWQAAMPEGMRSWANSNLAQPDLIHLTPKGYAVSARTFARAIAPPWNKK
jgi:lysophospholipase L1-like esterase